VGAGERKDSRRAVAGRWRVRADGCVRGSRDAAAQVRHRHPVLVRLADIDAGLEAPAAGNHAPATRGRAAGLAVTCADLHRPGPTLQDCASNAPSRDARVRWVQARRPRARGENGRSRATAATCSESHPGCGEHQLQAPGHDTSLRPRAPLRNGHAPRASVTHPGAVCMRGPLVAPSRVRHSQWTPVRGHRRDRPDATRARERLVVVPLFVEMGAAGSCVISGGCEAGR